MSFTTCCPEHPEVLRCLRTGYPFREDARGPVCGQCGAELRDTVFVVEGREICGDCFQDWLADYTRTNAADVADALCVEHYRV